MKVEQLMTAPAVTCSATDTLACAARKMWDADCGVLPVVGDDGTLIGVVTDRDLCMSAWSHGTSLDDITVAEAMARQVFTLTPEDDVTYAEQVMAEKQIRRLPIVDDYYQPVGILSINDIARATERPRSRIVQTLASISRHR
jgi:CBS domain-containing protein